ncbi:hypothetical protein GCM10028810_22650 [Spirosoma litoris]
MDYEQAMCRQAHNRSVPNGTPSQSNFLPTLRCGGPNGPEIINLTLALPTTPPNPMVWYTSQ